MKKEEKIKALKILNTPLISEDIYRKWWEEQEKRMREDPSYLPLKSIPTEEEIKEFE